MSYQKRVERFHAHLDVCSHCNAHPFDLCPIGHVLFMATALKADFSMINTEAS